MAIQVNAHEFQRIGASETFDVSARQTVQSTGEIMNDRPAPDNGQGDPDSQPGDDSQPESVQRTGATSNPKGPLRCHADVSDEDPRSPWAEKTVLALGGLPALID
jgi:hypothetical protein